MAKEKDLHDAFYETLKDVYFAEKHSVKACKKSAKHAQAPELKAAFDEHAVMSQHQVERPARPSRLESHLSKPP